MSWVVHKQVLEFKNIEGKPTDIGQVPLPIGAKIIQAREQGDKFCIWYRFKNDGSPTRELRYIQLVGTGWECPDPEHGVYLGTAMMQGGAFVFHIFELVDPPLSPP